LPIVIAAVLRVQSGLSAPHEARRRLDQLAHERGRERENACQNHTYK
jgi:hypothetical protein